MTWHVTVDKQPDAIITALKDSILLNLAAKQNNTRHFSVEADAIALFGIISFFDDVLSSDPLLYSYPSGETEGAELRLADRIGWRVVLRVDNHNERDRKVTVYYLDRITSYKSHHPTMTLKSFLESRST